MSNLGSGSDGANTKTPADNIRSDDRLAQATQQQTKSA